MTSNTDNPVHPRVADINERFVNGGSLTVRNSDFPVLIGRGLSPEEVVAQVASGFSRGPSTLPGSEPSFAVPFLTGELDGADLHRRLRLKVVLWSRVKRGPGKGSIRARFKAEPFYEIDSFSNV